MRFLLQNRIRLLSTLAGICFFPTATEHGAIAQIASSEDPIAIYRAASESLAREQFIQACQGFEKVVLLKPGTPLALEAGYFELRAKQRLDPTDPIRRGELAQACAHWQCIAHGWMQRAEEPRFADYLPRLKGRIASVMVLETHLAFSNGRWQQALAFLERLDQIQIDDQATLGLEPMTRGLMQLECLVQLQRWAEAEKSADSLQAIAEEKLAQFPPATWIEHFLLRKAEIGMVLGKWKDAECAVWKIRTHFPECNVSSQVDYILARCLVHDAKFEEARQLLASILVSHRTPSAELQTKVWWTIAETHLMQRNLPDANAAYERVAQLGVDTPWAELARRQMAVCQQASIPAVAFESEPSRVESVAFDPETDAQATPMIPLSDRTLSLVRTALGCLVVCCAVSSSVLAQNTRWNSGPPIAPGNYPAAAPGNAIVNQPIANSNQVRPNQNIVSSDPRIASLPSPGSNVTYSTGASTVPAGSEVASGKIPTRNLLQVFHDGGWMMYPIALCSFGLTAFVFERWIALRRSRVVSKPFVNRIIEQLQQQHIDRDEAIELCEKSGSPMANIMLAALRKYGRPAVEVEQAVLDTGERESNFLRRNMRAILAISNLSPLLGLLGTVLGMIQSFNDISNSQAMGRPELLAGGISQALLTTAAGLLVAIPAYAIYIYFIARIDGLIIEMDAQAQRLVDIISAEGLQENEGTRTRRSRKAA